jgi:hypothetical protein
VEKYWKKPKGARKKEYVHELCLAKKINQFTKAKKRRAYLNSTLFKLDSQTNDRDQRIKGSIAI